MGDEIRERGGEFGTTTGRPRRTGWLDLVALRYAARLNTLTALVDHQARRALRASTASSVCTSYRGAEGAVFDDFPYHQTVLHHTTAELDRAAAAGARTSASAARCPTCPTPRASTCEFIAEHVGAPVALVGVGPGREQVIWMPAGAESVAAPAAAS